MSASEDTAITKMIEQSIGVSKEWEVKVIFNSFPSALASEILSTAF